MKKYKSHEIYSYVYECEVEANNEQEAREKIEDILLRDKLVSYIERYSIDLEVINE